MFMSHSTNMSHDIKYRHDSRERVAYTQRTRTPRIRFACNKLHASERCPSHTLPNVVFRYASDASSLTLACECLAEIMFWAKHETLSHTQRVMTLVCKHTRARCTRGACRRSRSYTSSMLTRAVCKRAPVALAALPAGTLRHPSKTLAVTSCQALCLRAYSGRFRHADSAGPATSAR